MSSASDTIVPEVIRNALLLVTAEMKAVVMRTAYSTTWSEAGDLSCAVLTPTGELIAQGERDIPVHIGTMPLSVRGCLDAVGDDLSPDDVVIHNDPRIGNNHLPDFLFVSPVFEGNTLLGQVAVRAHWADVGGRSPGSLTTVSTDAFQEGLRVPPIHLVRGGQIDQELVSLLLANVRAPTLVLGDLRAQLAGVRRGVERVREIALRYGLEWWQRSIDIVLDRSEAATRAAIATLDNGVYEFEDACDGDGLDDVARWVRLRLEVTDDEIIADFSDSDDEARGAINAPYSVTVSATYFAVKAFLDPTSPGNSGSYRPISIRTRQPSLVDAGPDSPVAGAAGETANIIVDVVLGALSAAAPERGIAAGSGSAFAAIFAGPRRGMPGQMAFYVEPHGSAWGARSIGDGLSGTRVGTGNAGNQPVEIVESVYPIRIREYMLAQDAGGVGRFRGGLPVRRVMEVGDDFVVTVCGERVGRAPYGLAGGGTGAQGMVRINPDTDREQILPSKTPPIELYAGDVVSIQAAGGGGFGDPRQRPRPEVEQDLADGYISPRVAETDYGLVVDRDEAP